jgi:pimeloyl-ACP methyl ester carboxylesterase
VPKMNEQNHRLIYLHGFASSPGSNKATQFSRALKKRGIPVQIPDLNEGDFAGLTITRQIRLLERMTAEQGPGSVILIGSSLGAYVSALFASLSHKVAALVLMAPAFDFIRRWTERMSAEALAEWQRRGAMHVLHHATEELAPIGWPIVEDARQHPRFPSVQVPTLVIHGRHDESVDCSSSVRFDEMNPQVELELLDSDHGLADCVDWIIDRTFLFLDPWFK